MSHRARGKTGGNRAGRGRLLPRSDHGSGTADMIRIPAHVARITRILKATRIVPLGPVPPPPAGLDVLIERVRRLRSSGPGGSGRPTDPGWKITRIVRFKSDVWRQLAEMAVAQRPYTGRRVSPAQLAAMLIEMSLDGRRSRS